MTIDELIEKLEDAKEEFGEDGGDREIRVAFQPSWPLRAKIQNVCVPYDDDGPHCDDHVCYVALCGDCEDAKDAAEEGPPSEEDKRREFLWIAVDQVSDYNENPYAPRWAWG